MRGTGKAGIATCCAMPDWGVIDAGNDEDSLQNASGCPGVLQDFHSVCVCVGHFEAQWPCATIGDGVLAGVLHGLSSWHTGVDLACRLGDKTKILLLGFNIGDTSGVTNIPAFHPAMCPLKARVHPIRPELQQGSYPVVHLGFIEGTFEYKVSSPDIKNHTGISCLLGRSK